MHLGHDNVSSAYYSKLYAHSYRIPHPAPDILVDLLSTHESASYNLRFAQYSYPCSICLAHLKGSKCLQLTCGHIFCRSCLRNFWQMCVTEGDITRVRCPDPACTKDGTDASEEEVARVLTSEEIERWRWLKEKHAMEQGVSFLIHQYMLLMLLN